MADLIVTPASVVQTDGQTQEGIAGATILAGQTVYLATATTPALWQLADSDGTALTAGAKGVALHNASLNQPLKVQVGGRINPGATVVVGEIYVLSDTPGGIKPAADLDPGDWVTFLGIGTAVAELTLRPFASGVQVPTP